MDSPVSVATLLAKPSQFNDQVVVTTGVAVVEFEHTALYPSPSVAESGTTEDGIWLDLDPRSNAQFNAKFVRVEGKFLSGDVGHMGIFNGEISPVHTVLVIDKNGDKHEE